MGSDLPRAIVAMAVGEIAIYAFGLAMLSRFVPGGELLAAGLLPFVPGDIVKVILAALALPLAWRLVPPRST